LNYFSGANGIYLLDELYLQKDVTKMCGYKLLQDPIVGL